MFWGIALGHAGQSALDTYKQIGQDKMLKLQQQTAQENFNNKQAADKALAALGAQYNGQNAPATPAQNAGAIPSDISAAPPQGQGSATPFSATSAMGLPTAQQAPGTSPVLAAPPTAPTTPKMTPEEYAVARENIYLNSGYPQYQNTGMALQSARLNNALTNLKVQQGTDTLNRTRFAAGAVRASTPDQLAAAYNSAGFGDGQVTFLPAGTDSQGQSLYRTVFKDSGGNLAGTGPVGTLDQLKQSAVSMGLDPNQYLQHQVQVQDMAVKKKLYGAQAAQMQAQADELGAEVTAGLPAAKVAQLRAQGGLAAATANFYSNQANLVRNKLQVQQQLAALDKSDPNYNFKSAQLTAQLAAYNGQLQQESRIQFNPYDPTSSYVLDAQGNPTGVITKVAGFGNTILPLGTTTQAASQIAQDPYFKSGKVAYTRTTSGQSGFVVPGVTGPHQIITAPTLTLAFQEAREAARTGKVSGAPAATSAAQPAVQPQPSPYGIQPPTAADINAVLNPHQGGPTTSTWQPPQPTAAQQKFAIPPAYLQ